MNDLSEFVTLANDALVTDSRRVAKHFQKRHDNVLRAFDNLDCSDEYRLLNFGETVEARPNPSGGAPIRSRVVQMTKNGFMLLVMGFTGKEAMRIKEAYIQAFDAMSDQLTRIQNTLWQQMLDLERRDACSQTWASFGSKCMLDRKRNKPLLENERSLLNDRLQPSLLTDPSETKH